MDNHRVSHVLPLLSGLILLCASLAANAYTITYDTDDTGTSKTGYRGGWDYSLELQQWNAADFGQNARITGAEVSVYLAIDASFYGENVSASNTSAMRLNYLDGTITVTGSGDLNDINGTLDVRLTTDWIPLSGYDGTLDYGGTSGSTLSGGDFSQSLTVVRTLSADQLDDVTGMGQFSLLTTGVSRASLSASGGSVWMGTTYAGSIHASVTYTYEDVPLPGTLLLLAPLLPGALRPFRSKREQRRE